MTSLTNGRQLCGMSHPVSRNARVDIQNCKQDYAKLHLLYLQAPWVSFLDVFVSIADVLVFGVSSLIILCSACIFLAGVIVLKRFELSTVNVLVQKCFQLNNCLSAL